MWTQRSTARPQRGTSVPDWVVGGRVEDRHGPVMVERLRQHGGQRHKDSLNRITPVVEKRRAVGAPQRAVSGEQIDAPVWPKPGARRPRVDPDLGSERLAPQWALSLLHSRRDLQSLHSTRSGRTVSSRVAMARL